MTGAGTPGPKPEASFGVAGKAQRDKYKGSCRMASIVVNR